MRRWSIVALVLLFALSTGTLVFAKGPGSKKGPGGSAAQQKGKSTSVTVAVSTSGKRGGGPTTAPPGWSQGKKTGWHGGTEPPGLAKKSGGTSVAVHASSTSRNSPSKSGKSAGVSATVKTKSPGRGSAHRGKP